MNKEKMTLKTAERIASFAFGPSAQCIRHNDPKRDRRFAIYFSDEPPPEAKKEGFKGAVFLAGHGQDWESALLMANENIKAQEKAKQIQDKRQELQRRMSETDQEQFRKVKDKVLKKPSKPAAMYKQIKHRRGK